MDAQHYLEIMQWHLQESYLLDSTQVAEILPRFLHTLFEHMGTLEKLQLQGDPVALARESHAVRGALLNLGLLDLAEYVRQVEEQCDNPAGLPACRNLLAELKIRLQPLEQLQP